MLRPIDHAYKLFDDPVIFLIEFVRFSFAQVTATPRKLQPYTSFLSFAFRIAQLANEVAGYRRLRQASPIFAQTEREAFLI